MNGKEILLDTNIVLYLLRGDDTLEKLLSGKNPFLSFMTELELIGFPDIASEEEIKINELIAECLIVSLNNSIKKKYIELRRKYHLKLVDTIIAATAISLNIPFITSDKQFASINELNLIQYNITG
ncbi:MAG: type II toxin-antitoxin system VapC family toxin [Ginsengibacter sp.]